MYGYAALLDPRVRNTWTEVFKNEAPDTNVNSKHPITEYGEMLMHHMKFLSKERDTQIDGAGDKFMEQFYGISTAGLTTQDKIKEQWGEYINLSQKLPADVKTKDFIQFLRGNVKSFPLVGTIAKAVFTVPGEFFSIIVWNKF